MPENNRAFLAVRDKQDFICLSSFSELKRNKYHIIKNKPQIFDFLKTLENNKQPRLLCLAI